MWKKSPLLIKKSIKNVVNKKKSLVSSPNISKLFIVGFKIKNKTQKREFVIILTPTSKLSSLKKLIIFFFVKRIFEFYKRNNTNQQNRFIIIFIILRQMAV